MPIRVTVIVPVYNPGPFLERCAASMLAQTLPAGRLEVIFVDDGSTDDSPARMDALASENPHFRVIHTPNSGWPGRPRNIGIDEARGEYVQFLDQDDAMAPEALERLLEMATRNHSDIVIGKVASDFRGVPHGLFRHNRETCTIRDAPLIDSLTPHKMFRTAFLRDNAIRYPEGRRRLEDQLFMVRAYFAAERVSILGDVLCYFYLRRADGGNAGSEQIVPLDYYANLREVLDVVIAHTEPGGFRDSLLRRFYRVEVLGRLSEPSYPRRDPDTRAELFAAAHALATTVFDDGVHAGLASVLRERSSLLRAGRQEALLALAERLDVIRLATVIESLGWAGDVLQVRFTVQFVKGVEGAPVDLLRRGSDLVLDPAPTDGITDGAIMISEPPDAWRVEVTMRDPATGEQWFVPAHVDVVVTGERVPGDEVRIRPVARVIAKVAPARLAGGRNLHAAAWQLRVRVIATGLDRAARVAGPLLGADRGAIPALLGDEPQVVVPMLDADGRLAIDIGRREATLAGALAGRKVVPLLADGQTIEAQLPMVATARRAGAVTVAVRVPEGDRSLESGLEGRSNRAVVVARVRGERLPEGRHSLVARLDGADGPEFVLGDLDVDARGSVGLVGARRVGQLEANLGRTAARMRPGSRARGLARSVARHGPAPVRRGLRRVQWSIWAMKRR